MPSTESLKGQIIAGKLDQGLLVEDPKVVRIHDPQDATAFKLAKRPAQRLGPCAQIIGHILA